MQNMLRSGPKYIAIRGGVGVGLQYGLPKRQKNCFSGHKKVFLAKKCFSGRPIDGRPPPTLAVRGHPLWPTPFQLDVFDG